MPSPQPALVSVIMPAYNGQEYIREAIESVLAQTYRPVEVLVVDDGSPVSMEAAVSGFGPEVRYLRQENGGTASARNTGWRAASGEFIALLDQDDLWLPHKLELQVPRFAEDPRIGLVTAWMEVFDSATREPKGLYRPPAEITVHDVLGFNLPPVQTMIFRRSALEKIGGFDASLRGTDDWDINIRIAAEFRVVSVEEVLGRARTHDSQQGRNGEQMYLNSVRVLDKHSHIHVRCAECRKALRKSRKLVREYHYLYTKGRARAAWQERRYTAAITGAARAFCQHPPAFTQAVGRAFVRTLSLFIL
jgi:glycosyltransferase involved in cell wall biosynthesis